MEISSTHVKSAYVGASDASVLRSIRAVRQLREFYRAEKAAAYTRLLRLQKWRRPLKWKISLVKKDMVHLSKMLEMLQKRSVDLREEWKERKIRLTASRVEL